MALVSVLVLVLVLVLVPVPVPVPVLVPVLVLVLVLVPGPGPAWHLPPMALPNHRLHTPPTTPKPSERPQAQTAAAARRVATESAEMRTGPARASCGAAARSCGHPASLCKFSRQYASVDCEVAVDGLVRSIFPLVFHRFKFVDN